jgi:hypothetical protein
LNEGHSGDLPNLTQYEGAKIWKEMTTEVIVVDVAALAEVIAATEAIVVIEAIAEWI